MAVQNQLHPTPRQLAAFALNRLTPAAREQLQGHLSDCGECQQFLSRTPRETLISFLRAGQSASDQSTPGAGQASLLTKNGAAQRPPAPASGGAPPVGAIPEPLATQTKYRIVRLLGRGGMGSVYEAFHERMDRKVAIKVISPALMEHPDALRRFDQETKAAAKLDHPNVARAYDADEVGSLRLLIMEHVPGQTLEAYLAANGPLSIMHACRCLRQVLLGLQHAHEKGMVHRDLKPQNLMVTPDGKIKILDFGLAKLASEAAPGEGITRDKAMMGTPQFLAPEQALDAAKADIRADIYSLGCTLYCLLTGVAPFQGDTDMKVLMAHQNEAPRPLSEIRPDVPLELSQLVDRMLAKDPAHRPQRPIDVANALLAFTNAVPSRVEAQQVPVDSTYLLSADSANLENSAAKSIPPVTQASAITSSPVQPPRVFWPWVAAGVGAMLALAAVVAWAAGVFAVRTSEGTIIVENVPADAEVLVEGKTVTLTRAGDTVTISAVPAGPHRLKLVRGGREISATDVALEFGGQQVRARFAPLTQKDTDTKSPPPPSVAEQAPVVPPDTTVASTAGTSPPDADEKSVEPSAGTTQDIAPAPGNRDYPRAKIHRGLWRIEGDELAQTASGGKSHIEFGDPEWTSYRLTLQAKSEDPKEGFSVFFNDTGIRNHFRFTAGGYDNTKFVLGTCVRGKVRTRTSPGAIEPNRWYTVEIVVDAGDATVYLDGKKIGERHESRLAAGRIGLGSPHEKVRFRDILVTSTNGATVLWRGNPQLAATNDAQPVAAESSDAQNDSAGEGKQADDDGESMEAAEDDPAPAADAG